MFLLFQFGCRLIACVRVLLIEEVNMFSFHSWRPFCKFRRSKAFHSYSCSAPACSAEFWKMSCFLLWLEKMFWINMFIQSLIFSFRQCSFSCTYHINRMKPTKLGMPSFFLSQVLWLVGERHFSKHMCTSRTGPLLIWSFLNFLEGYISGYRSRASELSITGIAFSGFKSEHSYVTFTTIWLRMYRTTNEAVLCYSTYYICYLLYQSQQ